MTRWYLITTDETVTALPSPKPSLEEMQRAVGGYVEHVTLDGRTGLWVNEEGKLTGLPVNSLATRVWEFYYGPTDVIVGPALLEVQGIKPTKRAGVVLAALARYMRQPSVA